MILTPSTAHIQYPHLTVKKKRKENERKKIKINEIFHQVSWNSLKDLCFTSCRNDKKNFSNLYVTYTFLSHSLSSFTHSFSFLQFLFFLL